MFAPKWIWQGTPPIPQAEFTVPKHEFSIVEYRITGSVHPKSLNVTLTSIFTATGTTPRLVGSNFQERTVVAALSSRPSPSGSEVCLTSVTFPRASMTIESATAPSILAFLAAGV